MVCEKNVPGLYGCRWQPHMILYLWTSVFGCNQMDVIIQLAYCLILCFIKDFSQRMNELWYETRKWFLIWTKYDTAFFFLFFFSLVSYCSVCLFCFEINPRKFILSILIICVWPFSSGELAKAIVLTFSHSCAGHKFPVNSNLINEMCDGIPFKGSNRWPFGTNSSLKCVVSLPLNNCGQTTANIWAPKCYKFPIND